MDVAEVMALRKGIEISYDAGFAPLQVESNASNMVNLVNNKDRTLGKVCIIVHDI